MLVDSHCHLADPGFDSEVGQVLERAWTSGVAHVVVIGETPDRAEQAIALAGRDSRLSATAGLHPHEARHWDADLEARLRGLLADSRCVAVGETGLDYHYDHSPRDDQRRAFDGQLALAAEAGKPAVIHARDADEDVMATLGRHTGVTAILHSFSSGMTLLRTGLALGHYVSFSGMVTFRTWRLDDAIRETPLDRILLETDAPYLAPVPHRGRRNEPAFVRLVAERVAAIRGLAATDVIAATGANARRVFGDRIPSA